MSTQSPIRAGRRPGATSRLARPFAALAAAVGGTAVVATVDPSEPGHYPECPFHWITGLYCPGCGTLRAVHALTHGDVLGAIRSAYSAVRA